MYRKGLSYDDIVKLVDEYREDDLFAKPEREKIIHAWRYLEHYKVRPKDGEPPIPIPRALKVKKKIKQEENGAAPTGEKTKETSAEQPEKRASE